MPAIVGSSRLEKLEEIKHIIKALLIVDIKKDVTPPYLNQEYCSIEGESIPYKDYNFTCLVDFLKSLDDTCYLQYNKENQLCVYHISSDKSKHMSDLILKTNEKPKNNNRNRFNTLRSGNTVSPVKLFHIFNKLAKESPQNSENVKIKKEKVLSEILKVSEIKLFFDMVNLEKQLNYYSHILKYDDHYITFKVEKNVPLFKNISSMIKKTTINNLQQLLEKYKDGIICSDLPTIYCNEYKRDLEYNHLGFNQIIEFVVVLNDIMKLVLCPYSKKQLIVGVKKSANDFLDLPKNCDSINSYADTSMDFISDAVPKVVSPNVIKTFIPNNVTSFDYVIEQISASSLYNNDDVLIVDVFSPSFFWITPLRNMEETDKFVKNMDEFYKLNSEKYKIPSIALQVGLRVTCTYGGVWYRGVIKKIEGNTVIVLLYDYGSLNKCKSKDLYFLDKRFASYPAQAIPCSLYNIKPINTKKWNRESCKAFSDKVLNKHCKIYINNVVKEINFMIISLERPSMYNLNLSKWMITKELATEGQFHSQKQYDTLKHYTRCMKNPIELQKEYFCLQKEDAKKNHEVSNESKKQNYVSKAKKLEILRKYRERLSSSSQESAISSSSSKGVELNQEEEKVEIQNIEQKTEVQETSNHNSRKTLEDTIESTLSDFSVSESGSESYKITEHESSYSKIDSSLSSFLTPDNNTTLDSDNTEYFSNVSTVSSGALSENCSTTVLQFVESNKSSTENSYYKSIKKSQKVVNEVQNALKELKLLIKK